MANPDVKVSLTGTKLLKDLLSLVNKILKDERVPKDLKTDIAAVIKEYQTIERKNNIEHN
jgi:hypothetical protein